MSVSVVIMAAGLGTRMKSSTPKVLHKISNHPMLYHIINEAKKISDDIQVVLYHQSEKVKDVMSGYFDDVKFVLQEHLVFPGTGGALMSAKPKHERVLVLNGDMPLVTCSELQELLKNDEASVYPPLPE